jgi:signal transduction histidine kinase
MELPDFGLLVLVKNGEDIDPYTIKSLTPLNKKLADSARACLQKTALETSEKQLVAAHQRLQTLDEEKTTFLTYLTHEMNTPLNWIGAAELLDREELSDDNLEFIEIVDKGFKRLTDLIRAALSYFDLAGSPIPLALADVSLSHTVCDVLTANNEILTARRLAVTTDFCDADVIQADPNHLRDVVTILVDNAMAFSEPGASIAIDTARREGSLTLTITDHGKGIDPNDLPNIFKPFTMAEHKRSEGGYGFNLPKAQRLCDAHGWTIKALSEGRGHGARFVVDFITHANAAP